MKVSEAVIMTESVEASHCSVIPILVDDDDLVSRVPVLQDRGHGSYNGRPSIPEINNHRDVRLSAHFHALKRVFLQIFLSLLYSL
jgi:hypothetical protein